MSAPSLSEHLALVAADPALVGHPVVAGLVVSVETLARELAELREENAELRRQLGRHSGNSGQPPFGNRRAPTGYLSTVKSVTINVPLLTAVVFK